MNIHIKILEAIRVQVIGEYATPFLSRWYYKRANTSEDVCNYLSRFEELDESVVFSMKSTVPVYFGEI